MPVSLPDILLWSLVSFLLGSIPFSLLIGRISGKDIRSVGDGNPGATNALKAGGWRMGLLSLLLDVSKSAVPVGLAYQGWGWHGWEIVPVAIAPLVGSVFSPFLRFKGGKSLAVSLGIWIGLTIWQAPLVILASLTLAFLVQTISGWAVVASLAALATYLLLSKASAPLVGILSIQALILFWTHRSDLLQKPRPRDWLLRK